MTAKYFITYLLIVSLARCTTSPDSNQKDLGNPMKLWYTQPAKIWEEALPIGNGRLGAMVYGDPLTEIIQLNEETLWAGEPGNNISSDIKNDLPKIRQLIFDGKYDEAQQLANKSLSITASENNNYGMPYQGVGDLKIQFSPYTKEPTDYYRELDISKATTSVQYKVNGVNYKREVIASLVDDVLVIEISADKPASISCTLSLDSKHEKQQIKTTDHALWLRGTGSNHENKEGKVKFTTIVKPKLTGGELTHTDSTLMVSHADKLVIYLSMATNFKNYKDISGDADQKAKAILKAAFTKEFNQLKQAHIDLYKQFFDRVQLNLGHTHSIHQPTNVRLEQFKKGNDPQLVALYYQFGRYLLISSSQPGTQPANLQGLWNNKIKPPWDSKYTVNINTEMNYWPAESTNLSEMHEPLFRLIDDISETGKQSANEIYDARGWSIHHNTDIWRISGVVDGSFYGLWPMGGAWLSQHLWYHYLYTGDQEFLKSKYGVLKGVSLFYKDILVEEPQNSWMIVSPSMSPENSHHPDISIAGGTTMDNQLVFDAFHNVIEAANVLGFDKNYTDSLKVLVNKLAPMQIGQWGQLQEWMNDWDKESDKHRHVSHLYGLFPSNQISPYRTPELFAAAKTSLLARGDESTGWSMGWKVNLWARFLDGNHALKLISSQLTPSIQEDGSQKGGTYPNLFDAHPPFQIDGNFGCTSGITEMLLQSHDGAIHLLPALPHAWTTGEIRGLKARGGFEVHISWQKGTINFAEIKSSIGGNCRIRSYVPLKIQGSIAAHGKNPNPYFQLRPAKDYVDHTHRTKETLEMKKIYEYDIKTKTGDVVEVRLK